MIPSYFRFKDAVKVYCLRSLALSKRESNPSGENSGTPCVARALSFDFLLGAYSATVFPTTSLSTTLSLRAVLFLSGSSSSCEAKMSGSTNPLPGIDELRRRFAIWSLAIFGSLSGSGAVRLESGAWAAEDPPTEAKTQSEKKANTEAAEFDRAAFQQLVQAKHFEEAGKMIDEALAKEPGGTNLYMNFMLANAMINAKEPAGLERMESVAKLSAAAFDGTPSMQEGIAFAMSHQSLAANLVSEKRLNQAIDLLKEAQAKLDKRYPTQSAALTSMMVSLLVREGREEEAKSIAGKRLEAALAQVQRNSTSVARNQLGMAFSQYSATIGARFPDDVQKKYDAIAPILREAAESESAQVSDFGAYQSIQTSLAMSKAETDAAGALQILEATKDLGTKLSERFEGAEKKQLSASMQMLNSIESRIKAKLLHQSLVGQPAPEFEIEAVVNMPKVSWADLKGKVVLIDFWAVWCGPCIATFPHLQEWKKEYGDKGLVIVGVTRQYGYKWDKEQGRQVTDKEASLEDELSMLEEFRKAHELEHGFVVTPKASEYNSKFGVTGIPQAVLVDQNGIIQLIRVGSGEKNAEELEAKIKSLLGV